MMAAAARRCSAPAGRAAGPQRQGPHPGLRAGLEPPARQPGQHRGPITRAFLDVLEALLWGFHNSRSGVCFPSYERIAEKGRVRRTTVYEALKALEWAGVLTWQHRITRVRELCQRPLGPRWLALAGHPDVATPTCSATRKPQFPAFRPLSSEIEREHQIKKFLNLYRHHRSIRTARWSGH